MASPSTLDVGAARVLLLDAHDQLLARRGRFVRAVEAEALDRVERALQKLDEGTYGTCDDCGRAISATRIDTAPDSVLCVACEGRAARRLTAPRS